MVEATSHCLSITVISLFIHRGTELLTSSTLEGLIGEGAYRFTKSFRRLLNMYCSLNSVLKLGLYIYIQLVSKSRTPDAQSRRTKMERSGVCPGL